MRFNKTIRFFVCQVCTIPLLLLAFHIDIGAQSSPFDSIPPVVFVIMDTSDSMEFMPGILDIPANCKEKLAGNAQCEVAPAPLASFQDKTRYILAVEALTGKYNDTFWCEWQDRSTYPNSAIDYDGAIPHYYPCATGADQQSDGLIDVHGRLIKFSLGTFDPFVQAPDPDSVQVDGYSYGDEHDLFDAGTWPFQLSNGDPANIGLRRSGDDSAIPWQLSAFDSGGLVPPSLSDDADDIETNNIMIQNAIKQIRPYWTTPLSPALYDAVHFFENHNYVKPYDIFSGTGDPYYSCRDKYILYITDGRPTTGEGTDLGLSMGYFSSEYMASYLLNDLLMPIKTFVVGFSLDDDDTVKLNEIQTAGTDDLEQCAPDTATCQTSAGCCPAYLAEEDNLNELMRSLTKALINIMSDFRTKNRPIVTNFTGNAGDLQYEIHIGSSSGGPSDRSGILEIIAYRCDLTECRMEVDTDVLGGAGPCHLASLHENYTGAVLNSTYTRNVYIGLADQGTDLFAGTNEAIRFEQDVGSCPLVTYFSTELGISYPDVAKIERSLGLPDSERFVDPADATVGQWCNALIELIRGDAYSRRGDFPLGAPNDFQPVLMEPPHHFISSASYNNFKERVFSNQVVNYQLKDRPTVLFMQTHDGQLRAFKVSKTDPEPIYSDLGKEMWAYIPKCVTKKLKNMASSYQILLNGPMVVKDIRMKKGIDNLTNPNSADDWRTILIAGAGYGGKCYFAIDVTYPEEPVVLWEITNEGRWTRQSGLLTYVTDSNLEFPDLGFAISQPFLGNVYMGISTNEKAEVAVAVVGGGMVPAETDKGNVIYVLDLKTGEPLATIKNANNNVEDLITDGSGTWSSRVTGDVNGFDAGIVGEVSCFSGFPGELMTRCFVGDLMGQLWRVDLTSTSASSWEASFFYDLYATTDSWAPLESPTDRNPIRMKPALAPNDDGTLAVVFGTGSSNIGNPGGLNLVISLNEILEVDLSDGTISDVVADLNWISDFESFEMLTGPPIVFNRVAYFTTYIADAADSCIVGDGRVWGVHYTLTDPDTGDLWGQFFDDNGDPSPYVLLEDSVPFGLEFMQRPSCVAASDEFIPGEGETGSEDVGPGNVKAGELELVVQTGKSEDDEANKPTKSNKMQVVGTHKMQVKRPRKSVYPLSWGLIID